ncbi:MAG: hypothetical protein BIFFINMI_01162 [Phycisphaerae bacterium]|nr:hypothetical protein [Phycisphaerae bacterium]
MPTTLTTMTPRQRWQAAVACEPVDRLPFWPKLDGAYPHSRGGRFAGLNNSQLHDFIGSDRQVGLPSVARRTLRRCGVEKREEGGTEITHYVTPGGRLRMVRRFDAGSQSWHPIEHPVRDREGIAIMAEWYDDCRWELDAGALQEARAADRAAGQTAATHSSAGKSPLMEMLEYTCGPEQTHYLLADHPAEMAELMARMQRAQMEYLALTADHQPADSLWLIEDTSTTTVSARQYRELNLPHVRQCAELARAAGRPMILHMCGHLKAILGDLATLPVAGFEAFTAPPVGNTTLGDGRRACPDKCLVGGTHASLWMEAAEGIIDFIAARLDELPHHRGVVVSSAGVMPPACGPETIKAVCDWVHAYPARV